MKCFRYLYLPLQVESWSPVLKIPSVVYLASVFLLGGCFWEKELSFQPCSGCRCVLGTGGLARLGSCGCCLVAAFAALQDKHHVTVFIIFPSHAQVHSVLAGHPVGGEGLRHIFEG